MLVSSINGMDSRAELIRNASVITWDEAPMTNKAVLACMEEVCRLITGEQETAFGGKIVILLGDFRQTCPVIPRGSRAQVVDASIKSSHLWQHFQVFRLTELIRNANDNEYAEFLNEIGDGAGPDVELDLLEHVESEEDIISFVFPPHILAEPSLCLARAILAPTNAQIGHYNSIILNRLPGECRTYLAADSLKEANDNNVVPPGSILDYVARKPPTGLPPSDLRVKVGAVYRILRNFSVDRGLVKNTRVVVTELGVRLITVRILGQQHAGEDILIPRITFTATLKSGHTLIRRQFPLALAYAVTFHGCQGLTLDRIGVELTLPVFSHGQLYTALSRIRERGHGVVRVAPNTSGTTNITYEEILI